MDDFDTPPVLVMKDDLADGKPRRRREGAVSVAQGVTAARNGVRSALDTLGLPFVRPAAAWKAEADRREAARSEEARAALLEANRNRRDAMRDLRRDRKAFEKARDEVQWWNVFNGERRAARAVVRDTRGLVQEARRGHREARKAYPLTLRGLALRCHAATLGSTCMLDLATDSWLADTGVAAAVAAAVFNLTAVPLGLRHVADGATDDGLEALHPSQEERDLLQRLDPKEWPRVAEPRGLVDVVSAGATLTESGIQAKLTLNGQMDLAKLIKMEAQLRAALRLREGTRMELREGKTGGHARLTLRTRQANAGVDMTGWKPGDAWAINTVTGETIPVPLGKRLLFAGTSGSGKSWSARPLMAEASEWDDHRLVIIDRKHIEARNWEHRARIATELDDIRDLFDELEEEGEERLKLIPRGKDVVDISPSRPRITVFVDEGGELISDSKTKYPKDELGRTDYGDIMTRARTVARKYRAAEIILVWCTQKPALSGEGHGLDSQIAGQLVHRLSLALATSTDTQVVFGNDAIEKGWKANELPMPGFALFRNQELGPKSVPEMLKMRAMSPKDVIALPDRPIWSRQVSSTGATAKDIETRKGLEGATLVMGAPAEEQPVSDPWAGVTTTADLDDQIMGILRDGSCAMTQDIADTLGLTRKRVASALERLANDGLVQVDDEGCWTPIE